MRPIRSVVLSQTVAVLSQGWTPMMPASLDLESLSRKSWSMKNWTLAESSLIRPSGVTAPGVRCKYVMRSSAEAKLRWRVP